LTTRWRADAQEAAIDPTHDGNEFSFYYRSRLELHRFDGRHVVCEDIRKGCSALSPNDGVAGRYSYLAVAQTKDAGNAPRLIELPSTRRCAAHRRLTFGLRTPRGDRLSVVAVYVNGRRVRRLAGHAIRSRITVGGLPRGRFWFRVAVATAHHGHYASRARYRSCG
jgi:hypothetical protein